MLQDSGNNMNFSNMTMKTQKQKEKQTRWNITLKKTYTSKLTINKAKRICKIADICKLHI